MKIINSSNYRWQIIVIFIYKKDIQYFKISKEFYSEGEKDVRISYRIISKESLFYYFVPILLILFLLPTTTHLSIQYINQDNFGGNHIVKSITETNDDLFIVISETREGSEITSIWIMKIDNLGEIIWDTTLNFNYEDIYLIYYGNVVFTHDNGIIIPVRIFPYWKPTIYQILKVDAQGDFEWDLKLGTFALQSLFVSSKGLIYAIGMDFYSDLSQVIYKINKFGQFIEFITFSPSDGIGRPRILDITGNDAEIILLGAKNRGGFLGIFDTFYNSFTWNISSLNWAPMESYGFIKDNNRLYFYMGAYTNEWITQFFEFIPELRNITLLFELNCTGIRYGYKIAEGFVLHSSRSGLLKILQNNEIEIHYIDTSSVSNYVSPIVVTCNDEIVLTGSYYNKRYNNNDPEITKLSVEGNVISQWRYSKITTETIIPYYVFSLIIELIPYGLFLHIYRFPKGWYKAPKRFYNNRKERIIVNVKSELKDAAKNNSINIKDN